MVARRFIALLLACVWGFATAQTAPPVDGIYWDPHESGRGYAVETQDDLMFIAIYNYDTDGSPTFYFVQGTWNPGARRVDGARLLQVSSGPWVGGPFSPAGAPIDRGPVTFEFPTFTTARFTFNGRTSHLQRFLYGYNASAASLMAGTWYAAFGGIGVYFGEVIGVTGACTLSACNSIPEAFVGARIDGGNERVLVGGRESDGRVFFLLDSSTSYYELFVYELRVNEWVGYAAAFLKTEDFPDSGLVMFGHRLTGPSFFNNAIAPAAAGTIDAVDAMKAEASLRAERATIDGKAVRVDDIRAMLPALRQALADLH
jgi:hypothetical protein